MTRRINQVEFDLPADREELIERALAHEERCVSVGGLAARTAGQQRQAALVEPRAVEFKALARLIEFWRREQQLTVVRLAERAGLDIAEILAAEQGDVAPTPRVLRALSTILGVSYDKLLHLAGHPANPDDAIVHAAYRFAAHSERMEPLQTEEELALHEFIRALE